MESVPRFYATKIVLEYAVHPKNYAHSLGFALLWFCMSQVYLTHIHYGYFTYVGAAMYVVGIGGVKGSDPQGCG